ncbi:MAG: energy transducer TonB [Alteraurantiacibacter sp.]
MEARPAITDKRTWLGSGAAVVAAHVAVAAVVIWATVRTIAPLPEEPVVLVELPPLSAMPVPQEAAPQEVTQDVPQPDIVRPAVAPVEAPPVTAPLPREVVAASPPSPQPSRSQRVAPAPAASVPAPIAAPATAAAPSTVAGNDPRARQQEADYFSLVNAHLARNKRYPREARQARQQGVVTVRFTVARDGTINNASIRSSSGHDLLDQATLDLLQRVSPLPRFPRSMTRDSVTLTLPIEYSLRTN